MCSFDPFSNSPNADSPMLFLYPEWHMMGIATAGGIADFSPVDRIGTNKGQAGEARISPSASVNFPSRNWSFTNVSKLICDAPVNQDRTGVDEVRLVTTFWNPV